jgi:hypothetical protein
MARMQVPSITVTDRPLPMEVAPEMIRDVMDSGVGEPVKLMYRTGVGNLIVGESTGPLNSIATLKKEDIRMRTKSNTAPFPCRPPAPMPPPSAPALGLLPDAGGTARGGHARRIP